ncbi:MAG: CinA family nicotinamide mononucleotide deamidase-related protein [Anaerolineales bacterium]|nr:CinA family nicotinamide mononucleotide deamidase-related protein [Anaerolineales bacterium]
MDVEIIVIGDELILGTIADTNTQFIARALCESGYRVRRVTAVGDDPGRIIGALKHAAAESDAVIAAGGLGPTVDDPTREAAAAAAGVELVFHPELWEAITARFRGLGRALPENNRKQAHLPAGAAALPNPFGTAPGFSLALGRSVLFAVPGVPSEMEAMITGQVLPALRARFGDGQVIHTRTIHVDGLGESMIDERIGRWERSENPTVGLMAHAGLTDIRIVARAADEAGARKLIADAEEDIRSSIAGHILGADGETLAGAVLGLLPKDGSLVTAESGTGGALAGMLGLESSGAFRGGLVQGQTGLETRTAEILREWQSARQATHAAGLDLSPVTGGFRSEYILIADGKETRKQRTHLVPYAMASRWAANTALTALWNLLRDTPSE